MAGSERSPWPTVLLIVGAGVVSAFQVGKAPAALDAVQADLGLTLSGASWLLSAFALVGALAGAVSGLTVDRLGPRRMVLAGLALQAFASGLGSLAETLPTLLATRFAGGLGFLIVTVAAPTLIVGLVPAWQRARAMAFWGTFMPVGIAAVLLAAPLLPVLGWRGFWLANGALLLVYAGLLALGTRGLAGGPAAAPRPLGADLRQTAAAAGPWLLGTLMALFAAVYFAVFGFLPSILAERLAVAPETGSLLTALAVAVNVIGNLSCGPLLARGVRRAHILAAAFATMALCSFAIMSGAAPAWLAYAACLAFSAISGLIPVALLEGAARHAPQPALVGATVGMVMQGNSLGLVVGPAAAGAVAAGAGWTAVPLLILAAAGLAWGLSFALGARPAERSPAV